MFDFKACLDCFKRHPGAMLVVLLVVVVFFSAPFIALWRLAKRTPVVGAVLDKVPGAQV